MTPQRRYKRRIYILKDTAQPRYIFIYFVIFCMGVFLFSIVFSLLSMETISIVYKNQYFNVGRTPAVLLTDLFGSGWVIVALGGILLFTVTVFFTHRISGPLYHLNASIKTMSEGDFSFPVILRKKDDAKELAESLNRLSDVMSRRIAAMRVTSRQLKTTIEESNFSGDSAAELKRLAEEMEAQLEGFTLKGQD
ncbi:MAG: methyl-accepting chemotaxis protein [Thermodesulfobacteriota bacterium]|nr:methyl-accepting chemotaxis protein [Thermodesulfobacteriota bacterium]